MPLIIWDEEYELKVKVIDLEHRKLVAIINDLFEAACSGKSNEIMNNIITDLIEYTKSHFTHEEILMNRNNYPLYDEHKKQHLELYKIVMNFHEQLKKGNMNITMQVLNFLKDWLTKHILDSDKKFGEYLIKNSITID